MGPLNHTTVLLVHFRRSSVMTFLHLNIYAWVPSTTPLYPWFSFNIQVWWPFCSFFFKKNWRTLVLFCWGPDTPVLDLWWSMSALSAFKTFRCGSPPSEITNWNLCVMTYLHLKMPRNNHQNRFKHPLNSITTLHPSYFVNFHICLKT